MHGVLTPFAVTTGERDGLAVVSVAGEVDCSTAPLLSDVLASLAKPGQVVSVDMHATEFVDCAGLASLVSAYERQRELGGDLIVDSPAGEVSRAIAWTQVDRFITVIGRTAPVEPQARVPR